MLHVPPVRNIPSNIELPTMQLHQSGRVDIYASSICHASDKGVSGSIVSVITWPFRFLGKGLVGIKNLFCYLIFCGCFCSREEKIDWEETKVIFEGIRSAVCTSGDSSKQRMKTFKEKKEKLSNPALERFKEHIGFAHAKKGWIYDRAKQEEWYLANKDKIDFDKIFGQIESNSVLKQAVESFDAELQSKTKK